MKCFFVFVTLLAFCKVKTISQDGKNNALRQCFENISKVLEQENRLVTVVVSAAFGHEERSGSFAFTAAIPHIVATFESDSKYFQLDSSAIVLLDSIASLIAFNGRLILPPTLPTTTRIFIYVRNRNFSLLPKIRLTFVNYQSEYFVIEEEKTIGLHTFVWFTPEICLWTQLVEVNRFDKSTGRWQHGTSKIDKTANLHGCRINVRFKAVEPDFWAEKIDLENQTVTECSGFECALVKDFSSILNFKYDMYTWETLAMLLEEPIIDLHFCTVPLMAKHTLDPKKKIS